MNNRLKYAHYDMRGERHFLINDLCQGL